jgi:zinc D-Ala-D-Ala dipeptidase
MIIMYKHFVFILTLFLTISCKTKICVFETNSNSFDKNSNEIHKTIKDSKIKDTTFVNLKWYSSDFAYDMKYATSDNFLKSKVYECGECYLRLKTVKALIKANQMAQKYGFRIKLFDCYRPLVIQKKMWAIFPDPNFVANPLKGSIHNKGNAVDITLIDRAGKELEMGTEFDYFGPEASHKFGFLSDTIKSNRNLLKKIMTNSKFNSFETEWWHYNLKKGIDDKVSNFKWKCD